MNLMSYPLRPPPPPPPAPRFHPTRTPTPPLPPLPPEEPAPELAAPLPDEDLDDPEDGADNASSGLVTSVPSISSPVYTSSSPSAPIETNDSNPRSSIFTISIVCLSASSTSPPTISSYLVPTTMQRYLFGRSENAIIIQDSGGWRIRITWVKECNVYCTMLAIFGNQSPILLHSIVQPKVPQCSLIKVNNSKKWPTASLFVKRCYGFTRPNGFDKVTCFGALPILEGKAELLQCLPCRGKQRSQSRADSAQIQQCRAKNRGESERFYLQRASFCNKMEWSCSCCVSPVLSGNRTKLYTWSSVFSQPVVICTSTFLLLIGNKLVICPATLRQKNQQGLKPPPDPDLGQTWSQ